VLVHIQATLSFMKGTARSSQTKKIYKLFSLNLALAKLQNG